MSYIPNGGDLKIYTVSGVDGKTAGATKVMTTANNGKLFHPITSYVEIISATGLSVGGAVSVGTNATNYDNIIPISAFTGLATVGNFTSIGAQFLPTISPNTDIYIKLTTIFTATGACTLRYSILGYYL